MAALFARVIAFAISGVVFRLLSSVGLSIFSMYAINDIFNEFIDQAYAASSGFSPTVLSLLALAGIDKCITILVGAMTFVVYLRSLSFIFGRKI
ncbi:DUF2523 domain-containing protein [Acinetobacter baumannii]|nr:DUF2523 domain-containing protein [Acinetobacter baumannii]